MVFGSDGRAKRLVGVTGVAAAARLLIRRRGNRHCRQTYLAAWRVVHASRANRGALFST